MTPDNVSNPTAIELLYQGVSGGSWGVTATVASSLSGAAGDGGAISDAGTDGTADAEDAGRDAARAGVAVGLAMRKFRQIEWGNRMTNRTR